MEKYDKVPTIPGLTTATAAVFDEVCNMDCLLGLFLCGGTSISLQLRHRLSEDLDFEVLGIRKDRPELDFGGIIREVTEKFPGAKKEILGNSHFLMFLPGNVKLSFFRPENPVPSLGLGYCRGNLKTPSLQELLGMKMFVATQRNVFRDYYDIYSLLESGCSFSDGLKYALDFSRHSLHTKTILSTLLTPALFPKEPDFDKNLQPLHIVTPEDICNRIRCEILKLSNPGSDDSPVWKKVCKDGKYNFVDANGAFLTQKWFDSASDFSNGVATVEMDGQQMDINAKGIVLKVTNCCCQKIKL